MPADDKTAALVVALSAQMTKFEKDMKGAGDIADRTASGIEDRFSKLNPSFAGSFLGTFAGSLVSKGFEKAISAVEDLAARFVDLQKVANLAQVSIQDVFGVQEAAGKNGAGLDEATQSLRNLAVLLDQFKRGQANSLSALFDVNPQALKGVNVQALTLQQTFGIIANLVQNADTNIQKLDVAKAAGQAESMVGFLEKGAAETLKLSKAASDAAPDLQKIADSAKLFDEAWKSAVTSVKAAFTETTLSAFKTDLQDIVALLGLAQAFLKPFEGGGGTGEFDALGNSLGPSSEALTTAAGKAATYSGELDKVKTAIQGVIDANKTLAEDRAKPSAPGGGTSTADKSRPATVIPITGSKGGGETQDSFDRTEEAITRHTATVNADTIAVSQNNAAQAQLRAEFQLLNAIRKDDGEVTQAQIDDYTRLRASMTAEQALVQAHINLSPAHKQSFIDASEGAAAATANYDRARESINKINSASSQLGLALSSAFADAIVEGKSLNEVFGSLIKTLEKAAINSLFASFFNAPASGGLSPFAGLFKGLIPGFAGGTNFAPGGPAVVGENGPELVNLPRGSQVIPSVKTRGVGGLSVDARSYPVFQAGMTPTDMAAIRAEMARNNQVQQSNIVATIRKGVASDSRFLG